MIQLMKLPSLLLAAVGLSICAPGASLTYQVDFTRTGGGLPFIPTASFTYEDTLGAFTAFQVQWDVYTMDMTDRANALGATAAGYSCGGTAPSKLYIFLTTGVNDCSPSTERNWAAYQVFPSGDAFIFYSGTVNGEIAGIRQDNYAVLVSTQNSSGTFTTTLNADVPEPSLALPVLAMIVVLGAYRFRNAKGEPRARMLA